METKLKPCPFCGNKPRWCGENPDIPENNHACHFITCDKCCAQFEVGNEDTEAAENLDELREIIVRVWNMRHEPD